MSTVKNLKLSVRVDAEMQNRLRVRAEREGRTQADVARRILERALKPRRAAA